MSKVIKLVSAEGVPEASGAILPVAKPPIDKFGSSVRMMRGRTKQIDRAIDNNFKKVVFNFASKWNLNSKEKYYICSIDEHDLISKIIDHSPAQKEYYFLDIGAGSFAWLYNVTRFLSTKYANSGKKFHVIGFNGEGGKERQIGDKVTYSKLTKELVSNCEVYKICGFKLEELQKELDLLGLDLLNKVDFFISNFTFRHLVDPVGTFVQAYNLLKPESGFAMTDGFPCSRIDLEVEKMYNNSLGGLNLSMMHLLWQIGAKFLMTPSGSMRSLDEVLLRKPLSKGIELPLFYETLINEGGHGNACPYLSVFVDFSGTKVKYKEGYQKAHTDFIGDAELFKECTEQGLFFYKEAAFKGKIRFDIPFELEQHLKSFFKKEDTEKVLTNISYLITSYLFDMNIYNVQSFIEQTIFPEEHDKTIFPEEHDKTKLASIINGYLDVDLDVDLMIPDSLEQALIQGDVSVLE